MFALYVQERDLSRTASFADYGEVLDGIVIRSWGEVKRVCSPKVMKSTPNLSQELTSPRLTDKVYSPRISHLRGNQSPRGVGRGSFSPAEVRPSNLRKGGWTLIHPFISTYAYNTGIANKGGMPLTHFNLWFFTKVIATIWIFSAWTCNKIG